jgi:hypothetical protein
MDKKQEKPSNYTVLYWLVQDRKIEPDIFFNFLDLFWPQFIKKDNYVFLKDKYSEEEFLKLRKEKSDLEYWINLLTIDDFFSELENGEEKAKLLANSLVEIWQEKLKKEFPDKIFVVEYVYDKEYGDCGLTFYQKKG